MNKNEAAVERMHWERQFMEFTYHRDQYGREMTLHFNGQEIGRFGMAGTLGTGETCSLSIFVEEAYRGRGLAYQLIRELIQVVEREQFVRPDQLLFIDMDFSHGFWDHIGMRTHRYGVGYVSRRNPEGKGYEKAMTWQALQKCAQKLS